MVVFEFSEKEVNQLSAALALYASTFSKCGISLEDMPTVKDLIIRLNNAL